MKCTIVGSGNVAWHLARILRAAGHSIVQVVGRNTASVEELAASAGARAVFGIGAIDPEVDLCFLAVPDQSLPEVAAKMPNQLPVVHTSGATPLDILGSSRRAVWWPMQTLTKGIPVDLSAMTACTETDDPGMTDLLDRAFAHTGITLVPVSAEQRPVLHLAAVFACNFPNYLYGVAEQLLLRNDLPPHLLHALIRETAEKVTRLTAAEAQTGPAVREDHSTIERHLGLLRDDPAWSALYSILTQHIIERKHGKHV